MGASDDVRPLELATALTAAWLSNANTRTTINQAPEVLRTLHQTVLALGKPPVVRSEDVTHVAATSVRKSLANPDRIVSMIDGREYASLRRHLKAHGLTPEEYRARYGLRPDYPMVAPGYSAQRSEGARRNGLGRKAASDAEKGGEAPRPGTKGDEKLMKGDEKPKRSGGRTKLGIRSRI